MIDNREMRPIATEARRRIFERQSLVLACPACGESIAADEQAEAATCPKCGCHCEAGGLRFVFDAFTPRELKANWLNHIKEAAKRRLGGYYPWMIKILSKVYTNLALGRFLDSFNTDRELIADLGSGTSQYGDKVVCIDGASYPNVHIVCRLEHLPIRDGALGGIISVAVL